MWFCRATRVPFRHVSSAPDWKLESDPLVRLSRIKVSCVVSSDHGREPEGNAIIRIILTNASNRFEYLKLEATIKCFDRPRKVSFQLAEPLLILLADKPV